MHAFLFAYLVGAVWVPPPDLTYVWHKGPDGKGVGAKPHQVPVWLHANGRFHEAPIWRFPK